MEVYRKEGAGDLEAQVWDGACWGLAIEIDLVG